jgi:hypothetical protein
MDSFYDDLKRLINEGNPKITPLCLEAISMDLLWSFSSIHPNNPDSVMVDALVAKRNFFFSQVEKVLPDEAMENRVKVKSERTFSFPFQSVVLSLAHFSFCRSFLFAAIS